MFHIIDDDEIVRETTKAMVSDAGYNTRCYESGESYLQDMESPSFKNPTAVLTDITMPGISGYDLILEIRRKNPLQIVIFVSGNPDTVTHKKETQEACMILNKPFHPDELVSKIKDVILPCYEFLSIEKDKSSPLKCVNTELYECPFCSHSD